MLGESKDNNDEKVQRIFELIHELSYDTKSIDVIKKLCVKILNLDTSQKKTQHLKHQLKEFTKYPELGELIQGLVVSMNHNPVDNICERFGDETFSYKIILNKLLDLKYTYSFTYDTALLSYGESDFSDHCEIARYYDATLNDKATYHDLMELDLYEEGFDYAYEELKLKDINKEVFKEFMLAILKAAMTDVNVLLSKDFRNEKKNGDLKKEMD